MIRWNLFRRDVVASTSDEARRLVLEGRTTLPAVVWANRQTAGRGRGSHTWWSDDGSLTFTVALDPAAHGLRTEHEPRLALATAVAVIDVLESNLPGGTLGIRWPNDIEVDGRKLGGILPERVETPGGPRLLVGIGLNVRTNLADAPRAIRAMATTVEEFRGPVDLAGLLQAILGRFETVLPELARDDPALAERWNQLDTLAGQSLRVDLGTRILTGRGLGIDPRGGLRLVGETGEFTLYGGQVLRDQ